MTGYGNDDRVAGSFRIKTEVKSLNSKFLDFSCRVPKDLTSKENELKSLVSDLLKRGKVMLTIELEIDNPSEALAIDTELFKNYYHQLKVLSEELNDKNNNLFQLAISAPDVLKQPEISTTSEVWIQILESLKSSIDNCLKFRAEEGKSLTKKFEGYLNKISVSLQEIEKEDERRTNHVKERLKNHLNELKEVQIDNNRYEQEIIYYLEKLDITEEKVRLKNHLEYFLQVMKKESESGKKLGFISQEIGREINTIGSKANDAVIQRLVVQMKDELEKIKEQLLNIL